MTDGTQEKPKPEAQVVELRRQVSAAVEALGVRRPLRPWWELVLQILGGAAGAGVVILIMGALVMWVRLVSAGLPAEQGLSAASQEQLIVVGAHVMVVPLALGAITVVAAAYWMKLKEHRAAQSSGEDEADAPKDNVIARVWLWIAGHKAAWPLFIIVAPIVAFLVLTTQFFERLSRWHLMPLWYFVVLPFTLFYGVLVAVLTIEWACMRHVFGVGEDMGWTVRGMRTRLYGVVAVGSMVTALATQVGNPSQFPPVTVTLGTGQAVHGLLVARDSEAVYVGAGHTLEEVAATNVTRVTVGHARDSRAPDPLLRRLFDLVF